MYKKLLTVNHAAEQGIAADAHHVLALLARGFAPLNSSVGPHLYKRHDKNMKAELKELLVPPKALTDPKATEVLRAWIAFEDLYCSLLPSAWDDPGVWGMLLCDVARHAANALHEKKGTDVEMTLQRIRGF